MSALIQPKRLRLACGGILMRCLNRYDPVIVRMHQKNLALYERQSTVHLKTFQRGR